jgi:hypothetical protein
MRSLTIIRESGIQDGRLGEQWQESALAAWRSKLDVRVDLLEELTHLGQHSRIFLEIIRRERLLRVPGPATVADASRKVMAMMASPWTKPPSRRGWSERSNLIRNTPFKGPMICVFPPFRYDATRGWGDDSHQVVAPAFLAPRAWRPRWPPDSRRDGGATLHACGNYLSGRAVSHGSLRQLLPVVNVAPAGHRN